MHHDRANRLKTVTGSGLSASYVYNGLGDRLSQTVNGVSTAYMLDLNAGLTQVLQSGDTTYLYGNGRILQQAGAVDSAYFLGDALGSVRQMVDSSGEITLTKSYEPYGKVVSSLGNDSSAYGYTGEMQDASTGMVYLRSRFYSSQTGRFITKDIWQGDYFTPQSINGWLYVLDNPILYIDPSGHISCKDPDSPECLANLSDLLEKAKNLKSLVRYQSIDPDRTLMPVEALAQLTDYAYELFDYDRRGMMWGMTRVLVGLEPSDYRYLALQPVNDELRRYGIENEISRVHYQQSFVGQDWLPYMTDPSAKNDHFPQIGDWNPDLFDGTSNQAFHFWYYAASRYFDGDVMGDLLANLANVVHDPYFLTSEFLCGQDLERWKNSKIEILRIWAENAGETSREDYNLGLKGIQFGSYMSNPRNSLVDPGQWIRINLKAKGY